MYFCPICGESLIWSGDFDYEDYGILEYEGFVGNYTCPNHSEYIGEFFVDDRGLVEVIFTKGDLLW
ncbi:MAG: hypothetical protein J6D47_02395 [Peptostreptococcaceae bacterium]|nr:hypothetical protein [Peptostreptococcaceae bacterium]